MLSYLSRSNDRRDSQTFQVRDNSCDVLREVQISYFRENQYLKHCCVLKLQTVVCLFNLDFIISTYMTLISLVHLSSKSHKSQPKSQSSSLHRYEKTRDGSSDPTPPYKVQRRSDDSPVSRHGDNTAHNKAKVSHAVKGKNGMLRLNVKQ